MTAAIVVHGLRAGYGRVPVLHGIDLDVQPGEVVAVLGRNGVGKTTLARTIMGLLSATAGRVELFGHDVTTRRPHERARLGVGYAPQELPLFADLTVEQNLALAVPDRSDVETRRTAAFNAFPVLHDRLGQRAGTLSGGERKMLVMARALLARAGLLVLDEVTEGVQPAIIDTIATAIEQEAARRCAVLLVEQRLDFALRLADRYVVMHAGEIAAAGGVDSDTATLVERHMVLR